MSCHVRNSSRYMVLFISKYNKEPTLLGLQCIKKHSEGNTLHRHIYTLRTKSSAISSMLSLASINTWWHTPGMSSSSLPQKAKGRAVPMPRCWAALEYLLWHTLYVFTPCPSILASHGGSLESAVKVPPNLLFSFLLQGFFFFPKMEKAAQTVFKHSVDMAKLMTLSQQSTNTQPQIGLVDKCSSFHQRETSQACSVSPGSQLPSQ